MRYILNRHNLVALVGLLIAATPVFGQSGQDASHSAAADQAGAVISLIELANSEYKDAVAAGAIINTAEYEEASEFTAEAVRRLNRLPAARSGEHGRMAREAVDRLIPAIRDMVDPADFTALADAVTASVAEGWDAIRIRFADSRPSVRRGAVMYRIHCAECHGTEGRGDGDEGVELDPPPADLTAPERALEASLRRDFEVMSFGVPATAMESWTDRLDLQERWNVVVYLQTLRFAPANVAEGRSLVFTEGSRIAGLVRSWSDPEEVLAWTDADMAERVVDVQSTKAGEASTHSIVAYLRTQAGEPLDGVPELDLVAASAVRFSAIDSLLTTSIAAASVGDRETALDQAIAAYMQFQPLEPDLGARDRAAVLDVEQAFSAFRADLAKRSTMPDRAEIDRALAAAARTLAAERPSNFGLAIQAFVIILREGFEAILIVGAIIAFLIKTGRVEARRSVYAGVGAAVGLSLVVALLLEALFLAVPARQEVLEGGTMLVAVAVLFSASYWLVSKLQAGRWEQYLKERMNVALGTGGGLALGGVAFLAVFREGVETVLFYKALNSMAAGATLPIVLGFGAGLLALAVIYVAFTRLGVRIPMRPFFAMTSGILYVMATIFAGAGIAELQEAGVVGTTPLSGVPTLPGLGIHPTVETMTAQGLLIVLLVGALFITFGLPRLSRSREVAGVPS